jgi:CRISPR-associated protein Cas2
MAVGASSCRPLGKRKRNTVFCVIAFDIVDDRTRYRVVKELKAVADRVQKSVFECPDLRDKDFLRLKRRLEKLIDAGEDTIRYYFLCQGCVPRIELSGTGVLIEHKKYKIV